MLQHEFEALTGKKVETEDYNSIIDPMYMSTDMDKQDFCKDFIKHKLLDSTVANELTNQVNKLTNQVNELKKRMNKERYEFVDFLLKAAQDDFPGISFEKKAIQLIGFREVICRKLEFGYELTGMDKEYIKENIA